MKKLPKTNSKPSKRITRDQLQTGEKNCPKPNKEIIRDQLQTQQRELPEISSKLTKKIAEIVPTPAKKLPETDSKPGEEITRDQLQTR